MSNLLSKGDPLLQRMRRVEAAAKIAADTGDLQRVRWDEANLRTVIGKVEDHVRELNREAGVVARQRKAARAYSRCFNLGRR